MISYYELLGKIKEGEAPQKLRVHLTREPKIYVRQNDLDLSFSHYRLDCLDDNKETVDDNYHYYLADCFLESSMFDENIEILDKKEIEKIHWKPKESLEGEFNLKEKQDILARRTERLKKSINEIIDLLNKGE